MAKYPSKAQMIDEIVQEVADWDLETLTAFAKDVIRGDMEKRPLKEVRERWRFVTTGSSEER